MIVETTAVVVGAGPAGLAVSCCLQRAGIPHELLEREETVGSAWRKHYDRLHLHTSRRFSALPHRPMSRHYPKYPPRDAVVDYLERYVRLERLNPRLGTEVTGIRRGSHGWIVETSVDHFHCRAVVVATGTNGRPVEPTWPGLETFPGSVLHSSVYRSGRPFSGKDVLVVGFGNSGGEIALDLLEHGARPAISVRSPVNIIPRDVLGVPILAIAIPLSKLPARLADLIAWPLLKAYYPAYRRLGLRKAAIGPFRQIEKMGRIPLLDIGTVREIRRGRIEVEGAITGLEGAEIRFADGRTRPFDAIILATGYRPCLPEGIPVNAIAGNRARPPGLHLCGFYVSPTGMLREVGMEASRIASQIAEQGCDEIDRPTA